MAKEPVSIGNQKFIYDDKSQTWIDAKTKQPADKGLLAILESVSKDIPAKPKRLNIDRSVEPVTLGSMKYVYDKNMGWVDEKTKVPADLKLAKALNDAVGNKKEAVKKNISKSVTSAAGSFVSSKKDVKTDVAYRKISDGLAQALASVERMNGHSHNIIMMNRFRFKEDARVSREKAREGGSGGASQIAGASAAQTMAVMSVLVSTVTESMKEFTTALKDAGERGALGGGGGLLGGVTDVVEEGSNTAAKVVGGAMVAFAAASYAGIAMKKSSEDDGSDGSDSPVGQPAASAVPVNRQQQAPEEGEEEETEQTQMKSAAAGGAVAARAAKDIPTPEEKSEPEGGGGSRSRNIKVETTSPDQKMGRLEEPKTKPKTAIKVKKEEKKAESSGSAGAKPTKKTPTTAGGKAKPPVAAPSKKSDFFPKVSWAKAFASIGKTLSDMKKAAQLAIQQAASNLGGAVEGAVQSATDVISGLGETVNAPTKGNAGLIFQAAKRWGYDDKMAVAFVALAEKETGLKLRPEEMSYSAARIKQVWPKKPGALQYARNPQGLANYVYGNKYGNTGPNDGWIYRGRGFNGITFKSIYSSTAAKLKKYKNINVDLVKNPDALNEPGLAAEAMMAYFEGHPAMKSRKTASSQSEANRIVTDANGGRIGFSSGSDFGRENLKRVEEFSRKYTSGGAIAQLGSAVSTAGNVVTGAIEKAGKGVRGMAFEVAKAAVSALGIRGTNGNLDTSQLAPIGVGGLKAAPPAAAAFKAMRAAAERDGLRISATDAYRDYATQVSCKRRKGKMAATPGRSNHGWGLAFDLSDNGKGIAENSKVAQWLRANASKFGIYGPLASPYEIWHWEYRGGGVKGAVTTPPAQNATAPKPATPVAPNQNKPAADQAIQQVALKQTANKRQVVQGGGRVQTGGTQPRRGSPPPRGSGSGKKTKVESSSGLWKTLFG